MNIIDILELDDGSAVAVIGDEDGNPVGYNLYAPESQPRPSIGEEQGILGRFWGWFTGR